MLVTSDPCSHKCSRCQSSVVRIVRSSVTRKYMLTARLSSKCVGSVSLYNALKSHLSLSEIPHVIALKCQNYVDARVVSPRLDVEVSLISNSISSVSQGDFGLQNTEFELSYPGVSVLMISMDNPRTSRHTTMANTFIAVDGDEILASLSFPMEVRTGGQLPYVLSAFNIFATGANI